MRPLLALAPLFALVLGAPTLWAQGDAAPAAERGSLHGTLAFERPVTWSTQCPERVSLIALSGHLLTDQLYTQPSAAAGPSVQYELMPVWADSAAVTVAEVECAEVEGRRRLRVWFVLDDGARGYVMVSDLGELSRFVALDVPLKALK